MRTSSSGITRRAFLAALSAAAALPPRRQALAQAGKPIYLVGWTFGVPFVQDNIAEFQRRTGKKVEYGNLPWAQYHDGMVAKFVGRAPLDVVYVSDADLAAWAEAGWLSPVEDFPEVRAYREELLPSTVEAMTYKGKLYGLPYYTDYMAFVYNEEMVKRAGFEGPPATWDELVKQALAMKQKGVVDAPLLLHLEASTWMIEVLYALVYSRGGRLFDDRLEPVFDRADSPALEALRWLIEAKDKHRILNPGTLETSEVSGLKAMSGGQAAFWLTGRYRLRDLNTPASSQVAGKVKLALMPRGGAGQHQTVGWTRFYGMTTAAAADPERKANAWQLIQYLGGKNAAGAYEIPKKFFDFAWLGFAPKPLFRDPDVKGRLGQYADAALQERQHTLAVPKDGLKVRWFTEWDQFNRVTWQKAILRQTEPAAALKSSADKWRALRRA
jgi:multiple sugar transport system substrate-binding protein